jgi:hypothetical protein
VRAYLFCDYLTVPYSLDAIDPALPHCLGNVQWVCLRINLGKLRHCVFCMCGRFYSQLKQANEISLTLSSGAGLLALCASSESLCLLTTSSTTSECSAETACRAWSDTFG